MGRTIRAVNVSHVFPVALGRQIRPQQTLLWNWDCFSLECDPDYLSKATCCFRGWFLLCVCAKQFPFVVPQGTATLRPNPADSNLVENCLNNQVYSHWSLLICCPFSVSWLEQWIYLFLYLGPLWVMVDSKFVSVNFVTQQNKILHLWAYSIS